VIDLSLMARAALRDLAYALAAFIYAVVRNLIMLIDLAMQASPNQRLPR